MAQPRQGFRASAPFGLRRGAGANTVGVVVVVALVVVAHFAPRPPISVSVVVVGFRHAIMQISTAPLAIALAIYTPVACRQRRRHSQLYVRCLSS